MSQTAKDTREEVTSTNKSRRGVYLVSIRKAQRLHWCEVERMRDQMDEATGRAIASKVDKEVSWTSSQARMVQQEETPGEP